MTPVASDAEGCYPKRDESVFPAKDFPLSRSSQKIEVERFLP